MNRLVSLFVLALVLLISACRTAPKQPSNDGEYAAYISAYSGGHLSAGATIRMVLQEGVIKEQALKSADRTWLKIDPPLEGELHWVGTNVLEFIPASKMPSGTSFMATLNLQAIADVPSELAAFTFGWRTLEQAAAVEITGMGSYDLDVPTLRYITGTVTTNDLADNEEVEQLLSARQGAKTLKLSWRHAGSRTHHFTVDSIKRGENASALTLSWSGASIGARQGGELVQHIPSLSDFDLVNMRIVQHPDQHIVVIFSDPVDPKQQLNGLFTINGDDNVRIVRERNEVHLYPTRRQTGGVALEIKGSLRSSLGYSLGDDIYRDVQFESLKPAVRFTNVNKTILPSGNKNTINFEAVSLSAVDVRVVRIFNDNVHQFLQVNNLNGSSELKRVGRVIRRKTVQLNPGGDKDLNLWNRFFLDLDDLIKQEPGAVYRVELGFRKHHSLYPCVSTGDDDDDVSLNAPTDDWDSSGNEETSFWDYFDSWYYGGWYEDEWYDYDWQERDNPCHPSYYKNARFASRNVYATDLAIIAKRGENGSWNAWVSNMMNTSPVSGATIKWYNYQGQVLHSATSDNDGKASWDAGEQVPFLITARSDKRQTFLKVNSGESLSLARFDVSGERTQQGMKGFIYGERGVWRPGDTLFLSFMLQEPDKALPERHPVSLEIVNARGKTVYRNSRPSNASRHLSWGIPTNDEDPTGSWQARVRVGNAVFNKWLRIETVKPNRLKIALDFGKEMLHPSADGEVISGQLAVEWLHGAPGRNLRTQIELGLKPMATRFDRYQDFTFDDPTRKLDVEELTVFDENLNADGKAQVRIPIAELEEAPGMLRAVFNTRAYEPGGDFSTDVFSLPLSPFSEYVGLRLPKGDAARGMLLTDTTHTVTVKGLKADGRPAGRMDLDYEIYKVEWRWWWQSNDADLHSYSARSSMELIQTGSLNTNAEGDGSFNFKITYPDWGRYLVRVIDRNGGHATGKTMYVDWPGWAGRAQRDDGGNETTLSIESDKAVYAPGQKATITFPGAADARALITVENGSGVLRSWWQNTLSGNNKITLNIEDGFAPNVYVSVTLVQPHAQTANDHPMRLYGTHRIKVENPKTRLTPVIGVAESLEPEKIYEVKVSEQSGNAMSYTLAVVDEGLLGLTRFTTPDPHAHFYAQEVLGVNTWDLYDEVIGAYGKALKGALTTGGDEGLDANGKKKVNRFKPVVSFLGPFELKAGQTTSHQLLMPNYVGAVRVMVVARKDEAYGYAHATVLVKKPLMVLATLPRIVGPGESVELPVNVFAMEAGIRDVNLTLKTGGHLRVSGQATRTATFTKPGDHVVNFTLESLNEEGPTWVEVIAKSGKHEAKHRIEFMVRNPNPPATVRYAAAIEPGATFEKVFDLPGMKGSNAVSLEVTTFKPVNFGERLEYLIGYPHGCLEQTLSRAFPQLFLERAVELSEQQKTRTRQHVAAAITKIQGYQHASGSFSYWPGQDAANDWSTSYAGHFLLEARERGYAVPDRVLTQWQKYQDEIARNWRASGSNDTRGDYGIAQAYRLYTLALAGKPNLGAMNRLREYTALSETARWQLAAAYVLAGRGDAANELMGRSSIKLDAKTHVSYDYGSIDRDRALIARALISAGRRNEAAPLINTLTDRLNSSAWMSTQETAFALAAIAEFMSGEKDASPHFDYTYNDKGQKGVRPLLTGFTTALPANQESGNRLHMKNIGQRTLFVQITASGQPVEDLLPAASNGLQLSVRYLNTDGTPIDIERLQQGTDFVAVVSVSASASREFYRDLALTQVFPSGWEIINERMLEVSGGSFENSTYAYRDIRDDRVNTYFDLPPGRTVTYHVRLNAAYLGRFFMPATSVELMYDGTRNARTKGRWVEVVQQGVL